MRVFISVDMEGVAGIATLDQIIRGGTGYPRAQALMTEEANAAARGAFRGGASEVVINDSHGTMDNLLLDQLDPRVRIVTGAPRPSCMVQGLESGDSMAVFIGYHAAAGAPGVLAHTFSSNFTELRVNGAPMTEAEVNGLLAASLAVPVGVVTGDEEVCQVAAKSFPGVTTVPVKRADGFSVAVTLHPAAACEQIEAAVSAAVSSGSGLLPGTVPDHLTLDVDFATNLGADFGSMLPASSRLETRTLRYEAADVDELMKAIMAFYYLSSVAAQQFAAIANRR